jgi:hypothetical protein
MDSFICYYDVLGYINLLEHNSSREKLETILHLINVIPTTTLILSKAKVKSLGEPAFDNFENMVSTRIKSFVYSDTIIVSCDPSDADRLILSLCSCRLLHWSTTLYSEMFILGLPIRGCLHRGEFVSIGNSFAGKGFVEAYDYSEQLPLSAIWVTDEFVNSIKDTLENEPEIRDVFESWVVNYPVALKSGIKNIKLLSWSNDYASLLRFGDKEIQTKVRDRFAAHDKKITRSTEQYIENTTKYLAFLRDKNNWCRGVRHRPKTRTN